MKVEDLSGQVFGSLRVRAFVGVHPRSGNAIWTCRCECGNTTKATATELRKGQKKMCPECQKANSTLRHDIRAGTRSVATPAATRYRRARQRAEERGWEFELTLEEYEAIGNSPCALCGYDGGPVSVDRINSDLGYTRANCQPACRVCNLLKSALPQEFFLEHIERIYTHQQRKQSAPINANS